LAGEISIYLWLKFCLPDWPEKLAEFLKEFGEFLKELGGLLKKLGGFF